MSHSHTALFLPISIISNLNPSTQNLIKQILIFVLYLAKVIILEFISVLIPEIFIPLNGERVP